MQDYAARAGSQGRSGRLDGPGEKQGQGALLSWAEYLSVRLA